MEQRHHQTLREALETLLCSPLTLHRLQVSEARSTRQSTAPHQTVAQDGPLKEVTEEEEEEEEEEEGAQLLLNVTLTLLQISLLTHF